LLSFFLMLLPPPRSTLFPYTTLFRSYQEINALIKKYQPDMVSIESLFFFKNLKTALPVSQAKGVILLAAAHNSIPVREFTPLQRSEEHTSELQSLRHLVCRLLLEKKK